MWYVVQSDWSKYTRTRVQINHARFREGVGLGLVCARVHIRYPHVLCDVDVVQKKGA